MVRSGHDIPTFLRYHLTDKKTHHNSRNLRNTRDLSTLNPFLPTPQKPHKRVKHTQAIRRQLPTNCLSVFDHYVGLALKGLKRLTPKSIKSKFYHYKPSPKKLNISTSLIYLALKHDLKL